MFDDHHQPMSHCNKNMVSTPNMNMTVQDVEDPNLWWQFELCAIEKAILSKRPNQRRCDGCLYSNGKWCVWKEWENELLDIGSQQCYSFPFMKFSSARKYLYKYVSNKTNATLGENGRNAIPLCCEIQIKFHFPDKYCHVIHKWGFTQEYNSNDSSSLSDDSSKYDRKKRSIVRPQHINLEEEIAKKEPKT